MAGYIKGEDGVWREPAGYAALRFWFGFSRASWLTLPRALMQEMPDEWQAKMAALLEEWDAQWDIPESLAYETSVSAKRDGKFASWPDLLVNYRHPDLNGIEAMRKGSLNEAI